MNIERACRYAGVYSLDVFLGRINQIITDHAIVATEDEEDGQQEEEKGTVAAPLQQQQKPLFLYAAWQNCHDPYDVPEKYIDLYPHVADLERRNMSAMISALDYGKLCTVVVIIICELIHDLRICAWELSVRHRLPYSPDAPWPKNIVVAESLCIACMHAASINYGRSSLGSKAKRGRAGISASSQPVGV